MLHLSSEQDARVDTAELHPATNKRRHLNSLSVLFQLTGMVPNIRWIAAVLPAHPKLCCLVWTLPILAVPCPC